MADEPKQLCRHSSPAMLGNLVLDDMISAMESAIIDARWS
jgi:hypothetical protein